MEYVTATIKDSGTLKGFLITDTARDIKLVSLGDTKILSEMELQNAQYDQSFKTLIGRGLSLTKYPILTPDLRLVSKDGLVVLGMANDVDTGFVGYLVADSRGVQSLLSVDKLKTMLGTHTFCNFDILNNKLVSTTGVDFPNIALKAKGDFKAYREESDKPDEDAEVVLKERFKERDEKFKNFVRNGEMLPSIGYFELDELKEVDIGSASGGMVLAAKNLEKLASYYWCIYDAISHTVVPNFGTLGVSENCLYYDPVFITSLQKSELLFILQHECLHIALAHPARGRKKIHSLWTIATDLYINSVLCVDYGIEFGGKEKIFDVANPKGGTENRAENIALKVPNFGVYPEMFGYSVDLRKETPETIYQKLLEENQQKQPQKQQNGQGKGSQSGGQGKSSQSQSGDSADGASDNNDQSQSGGSNNDSTSFDESGLMEVEITFNGVTQTVKIPQDLLTEDPDMSDEQAEEKTKDVEQRVETKEQMMQEKLGKEMRNGFGDGGALVKRHINFDLRNSYNWKRILYNIAKAPTKKRYNLATPVTDLMAQGVTVAGREKGKKQGYRGVVICNDISGSVSKEALDKVTGECCSLLKKYDIEGEFAYWSTNVGDSGTIKTAKDLLKIQPNTTGGTNIKPLFKYLAGEAKTATGKTCSFKPMDIEAVIIITDGDFDRNYMDYARAFSRKTFWLIDGNPALFNPLFGRVFKLL